MGLFSDDNDDDNDDDEDNEMKYRACLSARSCYFWHQLAAAAVARQ